MVVGAGGAGAGAVGRVEGGGSEEDDGDSDEAGGARGSELAMLSRRNLPSWSRKSLSLPVVLVLMVESGLNRRHYIMRCSRYSSTLYIWTDRGGVVVSVPGEEGVERERE